MRISDWSSDVCSSDLRKTVLPASPQRRIIGPESVYHGALGDRTAAAFLGDLREGPFEPLEIGDLLPNALEMFDRQIGDLSAGVILLIDKREQAAKFHDTEPNFAAAQKIGKATGKERVDQYVRI